MTYSFDFGVLLQYRTELLDGLWLTIQISALSIVIGTAAGVVLAIVQHSSPKAIRFLVDAYIELIRNTPFLVHLFLIFFGLPLLGVRIDAFVASLIAMSLNLAAYSAEIVRGGIESIHRSQLEAGEALGLTQAQIYRHVIIMPALQKVYPALCSQFVLMMLASSVCSAISAEELTAVAANIESLSYKAFEIYIGVTLIYVALAVATRMLLAIIGMWMFGRGWRWAFSRSGRGVAV